MTHISKCVCMFQTWSKGQVCHWMEMMLLSSGRTETAKDVLNFSECRSYPVNQRLSTSLELIIRHYLNLLNDFKQYHSRHEWRLKLQWQATDIQSVFFPYLLSKTCWFKWGTCSGVPTWSIVTTQRGIQFLLNWLLISRMFTLHSQKPRQADLSNTWKMLSKGK